MSAKERARRREASRRAKRRGGDWEREVAGCFGGIRMWAGPGTDVEVGETVVECKSRQDDAGLKTLTGWVRQAEGYSSDWILAIKLGLGVTAVKVAVMPLHEAARLTQLKREDRDAE